MLPELLEQDATGDIARIYDEMRVMCGVPYVSSMQRHLATRPGWLEWAWGVMRPVFASGLAQTTVWRLSETFDVAPLPPISRDALRVLGVDGEGERTIRSICESFVRVSPTNLMFSGILRWLLEGGEARGEARLPAWTPPEMLPALPQIVAIETLNAPERSVVLRFSVDVARQQFVPGLYRLLARWPAYLAHLATVMGPRFVDPAVQRACRSLAERIDAAVPVICTALPKPVDAPSMPSSAECAEVLDALGRYREISPQLVLFGSLIRDALPALE